MNVWSRTGRPLCIGLAAVLAMLAAPNTANAGSTWESLKPDIFGERGIATANTIVSLEAPYRPDDQTAVPVAISVGLTDGRTIKAVTLIVDENPVPVVAEFDIAADRYHVNLALNVRFNRGSDVRAVIEASDGELYMASRFVKFAGGQAACSAPPNGSPEEIMASMGNMTLEHGDKKQAARTATVLRPKAKLALSHPNHTGMVLDQLTLLYVPLRVVSQIAIRQGSDLVMTMNGSISVSQDPEVSFDYRVNGAETMEVVIKDTDGSQWTKRFPIAQGS